MSKAAKISLWSLFLLFTTGVSVYSLRYLNFQVQDLLLDKGELVHKLIYLLGFYSHVTFGTIALFVGPFQFLEKFRNRRLGLHRQLGKLYVLSCILAGLSGLYIAQYATAGLVPRLGFSGLAVAWIYTTTQAYLSIRRKEILLHQLWMFRSFALTFAAVTLRLWLGTLLASGLPFDTAYPIVSWLCWIPNLIIVELIWVRKFRKIQLA